MSRQFIVLLFLNSLTTITISYLYNYFVYTFSTKHKDIPKVKVIDHSDPTQDDKIEYLYKKIINLENSINSLQNSIDDIEDKIENKNNKIIESSIALNSKLDDFINYNYECYD
jgi:peptidoglycan hydrolase CwlO-like protein